MPRWDRMRLRIFTEPQQGASYGTLRRVAKAAEDLGFDAFFRSDHYLRMGDGSGAPGPTDAWATLAALAVETSTDQARHAGHGGHLPAAGAARDHRRAGGRDERRPGRVRPRHRLVRRRAPGLRHSVPAAEGAVRPTSKSSWRSSPACGPPPVGQRFSYDGAYYSLTDSPALPKPVQQPKVPVIIGGGGARRTPALTARYADEFNAAFRTARGHGRRVRASAGRVRRGLAATRRR